VPIRTSALSVLFFRCAAPLCAAPPFPPRRSSDLIGAVDPARPAGPGGVAGDARLAGRGPAGRPAGRVDALNGRSPSRSSPSQAGDRKSTRLNSSHVEISYAVFCLKKKKKKKTENG